MGKPISADLRQRVCDAVSEGLSCRQAATRFKVSVSSAIRWVCSLARMGLSQRARKAVIKNPAVSKRKQPSFSTR